MEVSIRGHGSNIPNIKFYALKVQIDFHSKYDYGELENHKSCKSKRKFTKKLKKKKGQQGKQILPFLTNASEKICTKRATLKAYFQPKEERTKNKKRTRK